jgi:hypothetical protein
VVEPGRGVSGKPEVGFVQEGGRAEREARVAPAQLPLREPVELAIQKREQFIGGGAAAGLGIGLPDELADDIVAREVRADRIQGGTGKLNVPAGTALVQPVRSAPQTRKHATPQFGRRLRTCGSGTPARPAPTAGRSAVRWGRDPASPIPGGAHAGR